MKFGFYLRCVGKTSVIKQSSDALPHAMTPVKNADTMKFCCLFMTKYIPAEQTAADIVLKIKKNFRPNLSCNGKQEMSNQIRIHFSLIFKSQTMNKILIRFAGKAADNEMSDSMKTELDMLDEHVPSCACEPDVTTYSVT